MAASAIVLLAAHFEEYIRQQIAEYASIVVGRYDDLSEEVRVKFVDVYWRSSVGKMGRLRPKDDPSWTVGAGAILSRVLQYPLNGDLAYFDALMLCEHENNMRMDTILELCGRVGVKDLSGKLYKNAALKSLFDVRRKDDFGPELRKRIRDYYELRNQIVHSISQAAGVGLTVFDAWANFFQVFTTAFAEALELSLAEFERELQRASAGRAAPAA